MMGTVAGSRTWSDGLGSTSEDILCSVARRCTGSRIVAGNGSPSSVGSAGAPHRVEKVGCHYRMSRTRRPGSWLR